jgi:hypothetical protein
LNCWKRFMKTKEELFTARFWCNQRCWVLLKNLLLFSRSYVQSPILGPSLHSQANVTTGRAEIELDRDLKTVASRISKEICEMVPEAEREKPV